MENVHLLNGIICQDDKQRSVVVEAVLDDEWEMSGQYRAIIDGNVTTEFSIDENALWVEKNKGHTELAKLLGALMENYFE